jgi:hypothetical protein
MKRNVLVALCGIACAAALSGCTTNGIAKVIGEAAKDNASVDVEFSGWGVTARYRRNMPNTNSVSASGSVVLTPVTTLKLEPAK